MRRLPSRVFAFLVAVAAAAQPVRATTITLLYDDSAEPPPPGPIYYVASWNPETGDPDGSWGGYERRRMFDDGLHGDNMPGDRLWGVEVPINPAPMQAFEWAIDRDADPANGWLGKGGKFRVPDAQPQRVWFFEPPEESRLSREEIEKRYGLDLSKAGPPKAVRDGRAFAFTVYAPDAVQAYLPGSFNAYGENAGGVITSPKFRMYAMGNGVWVRLLELPPGSVRYKYAWKGRDGRFVWEADPHVPTRDGHGNTVLDLRSLLPEKFTTTIPGRELTALKLPPAHVDSPGRDGLQASLARTWVRPGDAHQVRFSLASPPPAEGVPLTVRVSRELGRWEQSTLRLDSRHTTMTFAASQGEGPMLLEALLGDPAAPHGRVRLVMPVVEDPFDDLRYGFYANWDRVAEDYAAKSEMLSDLLLNAMEYYDYFPAHGNYAPTEAIYEFEPFFGRKIHVADIRGKMEADRARGILAVAYIAAYATSKSVFDKYPFPMTNDRGERLLFNGRVLTEREADEKNERKWFWLMAIARDSAWHPMILEELRRALLDNPEDLVAFDGFEIDSYGHPDNERYFSEGSSHSGRLLSEVIAEFIEDVWRMAHATKEHVGVSFNCVCEFGIERMYHITDFLFVENWVGCKPGIEETIEILYRHRAETRLRGVLKMYPADAGFTSPAYFPADNLRLMLGICISGGGSLMIAGEPNERTGEMHALNSLYYPDNVPIPAANVDIIRAYNQFDAALYGLNHGPIVANLPTRFFLPGCATRAFRNDAGTVTVLLLNHGDLSDWNQRREPPEPIRNREVAIDVPQGTTVDQVFYFSPDSPALILPQALDFEQRGEFVRTIVPELHTLGALVLKPKAEAPSP